jgi:D-ribose pyranose/furanose isomerase RbsD
VTGGGDSVLNVWGDVTSEVEEEEIRLAEELVQKEQALANFVYRKDYKKVR